MIRLSVVEHVQDRRPEMFGPIDWSEFADLMAQQSQEVAEPSTKAMQLCISPAIYPSGSYRSKAAATGWNWFAADIDNKAGNRPGATIYEIADVMDAFASPYLIYTTASHQPEAQCFRLMFPLDRVIDAHEFDAVWRSFAIGFGCFDEQTKDISRLFIAPRAWVGRSNQLLHRMAGRPMRVDDIVAAYPAPVEPRIDPGLMEIARASRHDGRRADNLADLDSSPVVPTNAVEAALTGAPGGRMFRFLCSVACSAHRKGYALDAYDLRQIGAEMAMRMGRRDNGDLARDVRNALAFADRQVIDRRADQLGSLRKALTGRC
ncbi:hypothetical protein [Sphingomonas lacusdianchii]|uniref:hypothetical protein n=1 Tax=Sphingomonas lacusdianchii TaxID=2917992 RepID=UPI001F593F3E|nr:hypothetical protein [Sphingomonas sp. JXJ CY 53]